MGYSLKEIKKSGCVCCNLGTLASERLIPKYHLYKRNIFCTSVCRPPFSQSHHAICESMLLRFPSMQEVQCLQVTVWSQGNKPMCYFLRHVIKKMDATQRPTLLPWTLSNVIRRFSVRANEEVRLQLIFLQVRRPVRVNASLSRLSFCELWRVPYLRENKIFYYMKKLRPGV